MRGEEIRESTTTRDMNIDKVLQLLVAVLGGVAVIISVVSVAMGEPIRAAAGSALLGGGAIAFQFAALALGMIVAATLISAVIAQLDFF